MQKLQRQWLALSDDILNQVDQEAMILAKRNVLAHSMDLIQNALEDATTLTITEGILKDLEEAIGPFLETMQMLSFQRWQYNLDMLCLPPAGYSAVLDPTEMEGMFGETSGLVRASIFPQLSRIDPSAKAQVSLAVARNVSSQMC